MSQDDEIIFICRRTEELDAPLSGHWLLGSSIVVLCAECKAPVWVLQLHLDAHPNLKAVCNRCAIERGYLDQAQVAPESQEALEAVGYRDEDLQTFKDSILREHKKRN